MMRKSMMLVGALGVVALGVLAGGCASATATTDAKSDGSLVRTVVYKLDREGENPDNPVKMSDVFRLPSPPDYELKTESSETEEVVTATRSLKPGETVSDDMVVMEQGKPASSNTASLRVLPGGRLEYRETVRYLQPTQDKPLVVPSVAGDEKIRSMFPQDANLDKRIAAVEMEAATRLLRWMFGPPEPNFLNLMTQGDLAAVKLRGILYTSLDETIAREFGEEISPEQRRKIVLTMLEAGDVAGTTRDNVQQTANERSGSGPVLLTFTVKFPAPVESSNGVIDPISNTVTWAMYIEGASTAPAELVAVCRAP
ncbi:MAG: hypothetical protein ACK4P3_07480 [Fimbriimonadaceae bacterium]